jgi:mono/diheme cytochrome c family protein
LEIRRTVVKKTIVAAAVALAALTFACGGEGSGNPKVSKETLAHGKKLYDSTCASCHGLSGQGDGPVSRTLNPKPRDFGDRTYMAGLSDAEIAGTIKMGGSAKGMPQMPSHPQFQEQDLEALVAYIRTMAR